IETVGKSEIGSTNSCYSHSSSELLSILVTFVVSGAIVVKFEGNLDFRISGSPDSKMSSIHTILSVSPRCVTVAVFHSVITCFRGQQIRELKLTPAFLS